MQENKTNSTYTQTKNMPVKKFRAGPIQAAIWENDSQIEEAGKFKTISLDRSYKDKNGIWQKTNSMRINDLPKASVVLTKAYEYLILESSNEEAVNLT